MKTIIAVLLVAFYGTRSSIGCINPTSPSVTADWKRSIYSEVLVGCQVQCTGYSSRTIDKSLQVLRRNRFR